MAFKPGQSGNPSGKPAGAGAFPASGGDPQARDRARLLFSRAWWLATRKRMLEGKESPAVVKDLLRYAYGEPGSAPVREVPITAVSGAFSRLQARKHVRTTAAVPATSTETSRTVAEPGSAAASEPASGSQLGASVLRMRPSIAVTPGDDPKPGA